MLPRPRPLFLTRRSVRSGLKGMTIRFRGQVCQSGIQEAKENHGGTKRPGGCSAGVPDVLLEPARRQTILRVLLSITIPVRDMDQESISFLGKSSVHSTGGPVEQTCMFLVLYKNVFGVSGKKGHKYGLGWLAGTRPLKALWWLAAPDPSSGARVWSAAERRWRLAPGP